MNHLSRALAPVLADLRSTGVTLRRIEPSDWQDFPTAQSAMLWSDDGSGLGIWTDTARSDVEQVVMVAEQVQEWAIEDLAARGRPTNWPRCDEHPVNHPLEAAVHGRVAVWRCPRTRRPACEVGYLPGSRESP